MNAAHAPQIAGACLSGRKVLDKCGDFGDDARMTRDITFSIDRA